ncbi:MAG: hypothetical protein PEPC_01720 [Peptostreptococcus russellii]
MVNGADVNTSVVFTKKQEEKGQLVVTILTTAESITYIRLRFDGQNYTFEGDYKHGDQLTFSDCSAGSYNISCMNVQGYFNKDIITQGSGTFDSNTVNINSGQTTRISLNCSGY